MSEKEFNNQNTPAEGELMVTITLDEYREVVKDSARMSHYLGETLRLEKELKATTSDFDNLRLKYDELYKEFRFLKSQLEPQPPISKGEQNNV